MDGGGAGQLIAGVRIVYGSDEDNTTVSSYPLLMPWTAYILFIIYSQNR
jgi:hypothetical protein